MVLTVNLLNLYLSDTVFFYLYEYVQIQGRYLLITAYSKPCTVHRSHVVLFYGYFLINPQILNRKMLHYYAMMYVRCDTGHG